MPQCFSRAFIEWETLGCVTFNSFEAAAKFRFRAAASKTNKECGDGSRERSFDMNGIHIR
ncbi:hypothetical protein SAMCFNEI73_pC1814 (plasmid) [Sinorhizobium americanum]|uniref:Uncharacterized protein n=1 Tax=Sinorhizobium americanum TaxID=194963 RepID=A0A1L3LZP6_9HYPH|nr:hypothetical protein SAMCFNEI73_pC1814 [Sinorhizobium americanum]